MKIKRDIHERTLKNIIAAIFLTYEPGKILHLDDLYSVVERTPRYRLEENSRENTRDKLQNDDIFIKVNPNVNDGYYKLREDLFIVSEVDSDEHQR